MKEEINQIPLLTFHALRQANVERCNDVFHNLDDWSLTDWATAMAGECGEACNLIKKIRRGESIEISELGKELADIVIYADLLAARAGIDLGNFVASKFNEVSARRSCDIVLFNGEGGER